MHHIRLLPKTLKRSMCKVSIVVKYIRQKRLTNNTFSSPNGQTNCFAQNLVLSLVFFINFICNSFSNWVLLLWILFVTCICVCHTGMFNLYSLVVTCWERADLLALLYVIFSCVFVTFPNGVLCRVWYLIVSICDIYLLSYLEYLLLVLPYTCSSVLGTILTE